MDETESIESYAGDWMKSSSDEIINQKRLIEGINRMEQCSQIRKMGSNRAHYEQRSLIGWNHRMDEERH